MAAMGDDEVRAESGGDDLESRLAVAACPSEAELIGSLADFAFIGLAVDGTVGSWNATATKLFGLTKAQAIGRRLGELNLLAEAGWAQPEDLLALVAARGRLEQTLSYRRDKGTHWHGNTVLTAVRSDHGDLRGFAHVTREVKRYESTGTASATPEVLQLLVEGVQDYAIFSLDATGCIQSWNQGAQRIKGYVASEVIGQHFSLFYRPEDVERGWPAEELSRATELGKYEDEGWRVRKGGTLFWANVIITAIRDASGALLGFSKVTRDLTERKRLEEELRQREENFRHLVESVPGHAMYIVDAEGRIATWNAGAQRLLGYEACQVLRQPTSILYTEQDRKSNQFALAVQTARERGQIRFRAWRQRADGVALWVEVTSTSLLDAQGKCRGFVQVIRDLTEVQRMETLESEGRRTAEFIAMLSHELRNPLAPIRNATTLLKRFADGRQEATWCAHLIDRQVTHLTRLVDDLLDVSRVATGKVRVANEPCDLRRIVEDAVESMRPMVVTHGHTLATDIVAVSVPLMGDATRLTQVVVNLLTNATKYTPAPGAINVSLACVAGLATLQVSDNGIGMAPEFADRAFDPFVQGERGLARAEGGLGVGLALVKGIVHLHGGTVLARSEGEGKGTSIVVKLPVPTHHEESARPSAQPRADVDKRTSRRVLVVDDNADAADTVAMMLRLDGHQVEVAYDGLSGLAAAEELQPEVAILDLGLPGLNGFELASRLRGMQGLQRLELIALTGYGQQRDMAAAKDAGFDHHLTKPASADELSRLLR